MTKRFAIYDTTTGAILRIVHCPEPMAGLQCQAGQAYALAPDSVSDVSHRFEGGAFVEV